MREPYDILFIIPFIVWMLALMEGNKVLNVVVMHRDERDIQEEMIDEVIQNLAERDEYREIMVMVINAEKLMQVVQDLENSDD
jgi:riboflavin synthase